MAFLSGLAAGIDDFLGGRLKSPDRKKPRGSDDRERAPERNAFALAQSEWLKRAVGGALGHMGKAIDERFQAIEAADVTVAERVGEQEKRMGDFAKLSDE
eukprot:15466300-Alexandrium_andersonii.AAC.1